MQRHQRDMQESSGSHLGATPWRIFVCMLDKWEIGGPLTDALVYDALRVCYGTFGVDAGRNSEVGPLWLIYKLATSLLLQIFVAMLQLYEAVQPWAFWKQIFSAVHAGLITPQHRTEVTCFNPKLKVHYVTFIVFPNS